MSDAISDAALAFDSAMGKGPAPKAESSEGPVERMFDSNHEEDEQAGGDDIVESEDDTRGSAAPDEDDEAEEAGEGGEEGADDDAAEDKDDEGDEQDDEDDDEGDGADLNQKFVVTVDGAEQEVTLQEALNGYIRTETFHRRLNKLNEASTTVSQAAQQVMQDRQRYAELIDDMEAHLKALVPEEPDWDALAEKDPATFARLRRQYDDYHKHLDALKEQKEKTVKERQEAEAQQYREYVASENAKMLRDMTEWSGPKGQERMKSDLAAMAQTAKSVGFTDEEINSAVDSRMLKVLLKAAKYDRLMANKPRPVPSGKRGQKPAAAVSGAGPAISGRTAPKGLARASKRLQKTGSVDDAAEFFTGLITSKRRR